MSASILMIRNNDIKDEKLDHTCVVEGGRTIDKCKCIQETASADEGTRRALLLQGGR